ncbi:NUDIX domain-containing protein [Pseudomonas sp. S3_E04]
MRPNKACPIILSHSHPPRILLFRHPLAGVQIVKGTIEAGESARQAALRELNEEAGIDCATVSADLGCWDADHLAQVWSFHLCDPRIALPSNGHTTRVTAAVLPLSSSGHRSTIYLMTNVIPSFADRYVF